VRPLANVSAEAHGAFAVASVSGEVDASNAAWVGSRLRGMVTNASETLTVDLSDTSYLDSAGIAMLFKLAADLQLHQLRLELVVAGATPIARMVGLTGLDRAVRTHPTLDAALAAR
jgi:anti-sigma B factor antagonist/stage II sporulation protein AA (anti-sigma F factor antagonist)